MSCCAKPHFSSKWWTKVEGSQCFAMVTRMCPTVIQTTWNFPNEIGNSCNSISIKFSEAKQPPKSCFLHCKLFNGQRHSQASNWNGFLFLSSCQHGWRRRRDLLWAYSFTNSGYLWELVVKHGWLHLLCGCLWTYFHSDAIAMKKEAGFLLSSLRMLPYWVK